MSEIEAIQRVIEILLGCRSLDDTITIPAAADPANDVSFYGALRKVFDENTVLYNDWLNGGRLDLILDTLALEATLATVDGIVDNILVDTDELQISLADGGFTDLLIDAIKAKTDNLPVDPADASDIATAHALLATEAKQDIIDTNVDDIETDTNEIQISLADGGFTDLLIDAIKVVTDALPNAGALSDLATVLTDTNELQADTTREFKAIKTLTFANLAAAADLFTVTGSVIAKIVAICTTLVASAAAGNIEVGIAGTTGVIIPTTVASAIVAGEIWHDAAPDAEIEALSTRREFIIADGNDIILTPSAQIDSGVIVFVCTYSVLEAGSTLVAA